MMDAGLMSDPYSAELSITAQNEKQAHHCRCIPITNNALAINGREFP